MSLKVVMLPVFLSNFFFWFSFFFFFFFFLTADYQLWLSFVFFAVNSCQASYSQYGWSQLEKAYQISFWSLKNKRPACGTHICRCLNTEIDIFKNASMLEGKAEQPPCLPLSELFLPFHANTRTPAQLSGFISSHEQCSKCYCVNT